MANLPKVYLFLLYVHCIKAYKKTKSTHIRRRKTIEANNCKEGGEGQLFANRKMKIQIKYRSVITSQGISLLKNFF